jgi:hypothetical protein
MKKRFKWEAIKWLVAVFFIVLAALMPMKELLWAILFLFIGAAIIWNLVKKWIWS